MVMETLREIKDGIAHLVPRIEIEIPE